MKVRRYRGTKECCFYVSLMCFTPPLQTPLLWIQFSVNPSPLSTAPSFSPLLSLHFLLSDTPDMNVPSRFSHCSSPLTPFTPLDPVRMMYWTGRAPQRHLAASQSVPHPAQMKDKNVTPYPLSAPGPPIKVKHHTPLSTIVSAADVLNWSQCFHGGYLKKNWRSNESKLPFKNSGCDGTS